MRNHRTITRLLGGAALAATISLGGLTVAAAANEPDGTQQATRSEWLCEHVDEVAERLDRHQEWVARRIERLTGLRVRAEDAGRARLVARIDAVLARLELATVRLEDREVRFGELVAEHCPS